jgi:uncharacterized membrane protein
MKAFKLAAAAVCGTLGGAFAGSSHAQQTQNPTFELAMCNLSDFQGVFVALRYKQDAQIWAVEGWFAIPDGGCAFIGSFLRDTIYYFAESIDGGVWRAADTDKTATSGCIDHNKRFKWVENGSSCPAGQVTAKFRLITVPTNLSRLTYTLTGRR